MLIRFRDDRPLTRAVLAQHFAAELRKAPIVLSGQLVITPLRASRWVVAYASVLEVLRHGRPIAFAAGVLVGILLALTALLSTSSRGDNSGPTSEFEGSAVAASMPRGVLATHRAEDPETARSRRAEGDAATTATDELPGSDPLPLTTQASGAERDLAAVLADSITVADGLTGLVPMLGAERDRGSEQEAAARQLALAAIDAAAAEFGHEAERMRIVTFCESSWNPRAIGDGGTSFGLWQFQMPTWRANVRRAGFEYSDGDVFDPVASSRVAAWMWANGGELLWTCARSMP